MNQDIRKQRAAEAALDLIEDGSVIGVGTGSTVNYFIEGLASLRGRIGGAVSSSEASAQRLRAHAIPVLDLNATGELPLYVDGADEATRGFALMDHNVVAGDTSGKIGHRVRALVPKRPRSNGWLPVPGWTGEHEWDGMVPFEDMPHVIAPEKGMIVTANNRVVEPEREPYLSTDPMPPHRTRRIWLRLNELKRPSPEQMPSIHRDLLSIPAIEIR